MSDLSKGTRKRLSALFDFAAPEMPGVKTVYALLNEMAHFGSTALWHPGRTILLRRAARSQDVAAAEAFSDAAETFDRLVILGMGLALPSGLITAWTQGYP